MVNSGRISTEKDDKKDKRTAAKLTAAIGGVVFVLFLCSSVSGISKEASANADPAEGIYPVFNIVTDSYPTDAVPDSDVIAVEDDSVWAYLESVIARLIYGEE